MTNITNKRLGPMGSPLSPILTDIVMQDIEEKKLPFVVPIPFRYVDDILLAVSKNSYDIILQVFLTLYTTGSNSLMS